MNSRVLVDGLEFSMAWVVYEDVPAVKGKLTTRLAWSSCVGSNHGAWQYENRKGGIKVSVSWERAIVVNDVSLCRSSLPLVSFRLYL